MKPFFCRVGTKKDLVETIQNLMPHHKTYVEPFVGGGSVFWYIDKPDKVVINDLDENLIEGYNLLKKEGLKDLQMPATLEGKRALVNRKARNKGERLLQLLLISCNTFGNIGKGKIYKNTNARTKLEQIGEYANVLQNVKILSEDYKQVIKKYDSIGTFFFLDPPYEKSKSLYKNSNINYEEMNRLLSNIKGSFMLTINDCPKIRNVFSNFNIKSIVVKAKNKNNNVGGKDRRELIIMNYFF